MFATCCNDAEAVKWYRKVDKQEAVDTEYALAICYREGKGVKKDEDTALGWLRIAANHRHQVAKATLRREPILIDWPGKKGRGFWKL